MVEILAAERASAANRAAQPTAASTLGMYCTCCLNATQQLLPDDNLAQRQRCLRSDQTVIFPSRPLDCSHIFAVSREVRASYCLF